MIKSIINWIVELITPADEVRLKVELRRCLYCHKKTPITMMIDSQLTMGNPICVNCWGDLRQSYERRLERERLEHEISVIKRKKVKTQRKRTRRREL